MNNWNESKWIPNLCGTHPDSMFSFLAQKCFYFSCVNIIIIIVEVERCRCHIHSGSKLILSNVDPSGGSLCLKQTDTTRSNDNFCVSKRNSSARPTENLAWYMPWWMVTMMTSRWEWKMCFNISWTVKKEFSTSAIQVSRLFGLRYFTNSQQLVCLLPNQRWAWSERRQRRCAQWKVKNLVA